MSEVRSKPVDVVQLLSDRLSAARNFSQEDLRRVMYDPGGDTSRLSFATGLFLGLAVGVVVALIAIVTSQHSLEDVCDTQLQLQAS